MISPAAAAWVFVGLTAVVALFQLALAMGAPWGAYAMGGKFPGRFPPPMRIAALVQVALLAAFAGVVLARAGVALPDWRAGWLAWIVVGLMALGVMLNLITRSPRERMIWAPVAILLFLASLRVALAN